MELSGLVNLTEIPDFSRIPNLKKLLVEDCPSLIKVDNSVGFLNKLTVLSFINCRNLFSLPKSLNLKSLETLHLRYCLMLENFPKIECEMERLRDLRLEFLAIKDLPSLPIYFTGLSDVIVRRCENLILLPSSILQLQHVESLYVQECPNLVMLPTNVWDERQSMLSIESTEESRDLFLPPSLPNSSIFDVGCSSVVPALTGVKLNALCVDHGTPGDLDIRGSEIDSLPAWIKTFVTLRSLWLDECKQLQEILELPANIENVIASGCVSLKRFPQISRENQFNTSQLPALKWIDLSDCNDMAEKIGKEVEDSLLDKVCLSLMYAFVCVLVYGLC